jgi:hypothetical protein
VLSRVKEDRNSLSNVKRRKVNWMDHILRTNCLLKDVTDRTVEGRVEVTEKREGRRKWLLDDLKETREFWKLIEGPLALNPWRNRCARGYGSVVRQTTE